MNPDRIVGTRQVDARTFHRRTFALGTTALILGGAAVVGGTLRANENDRPLILPTRTPWVEPPPPPEPTPTPEVDERYIGKPIVPSTEHEGEYVFADIPPASEGVSILPLAASIFMRDGRLVIEPNRSSVPSDGALGYLSPRIGLDGYFFARLDKSPVIAEGIDVYLEPYELFDSFGAQIPLPERLVRTPNGRLLRSGVCKEITHRRLGQSPTNPTRIYLPQMFFDLALNEVVIKKAREAGYGMYVQKASYQNADIPYTQYKVTTDPLVKIGEPVAEHIIINPNTNPIDSGQGVVLLDGPNADPYRVIDVVGPSTFHEGIVFADTFGGDYATQYDGKQNSIAQQIHVTSEDGLSTNLGSLYKTLIRPPHDTVTHQGVKTNFQVCVFPSQVNHPKIGPRHYRNLPPI